jgi:Cys-tRNA(Pro)/Cys-tRNA(Cys) deacylase
MSRLMAATRGTKALGALGVPFRVHVYEHAAKGAAFAAESLGIEPGRLAKTLVAEVDGEPVFVLVPGDLSLSLKALARAAGGKAAVMAQPSAAERLTGYQVGGISPFGARKPLRVFAERRFLEHDQVALNAGGRGVIVELGRDDLVRALSPTVAELAG